MLPPNIKQLLRWAHTWILEISFVAAIFGIVAFAALSAFYPCVLVAIPAFACGWAVGVFHGVQGEISRNGVTNEKDTNTR